MLCNTMYIASQTRSQHKYVDCIYTKHFLDIVSLRPYLLINYFLAGLFLTSSSLQACNIILFGCPGVMPE